MASSAMTHRLRTLEEIDHAAKIADLVDSAFARQMIE